MLLRKRSIAIIAGVLAGLLGLSGKTSPAVQPCTVMVPAPPRLVYPMPGATGVPDGNFTMVVSFKPVLPITLVGNTAVVGPLVPAMVPNPLPTPLATPRPAGHQAAYAVGPLAPATTYTLTMNVPANQHCPAKVETGGSFTTR
jgi:hypothetical protein